MRRTGDVRWTKALDSTDYRSTIGLMSNGSRRDDSRVAAEGTAPARRPRKPAAVEDVVVRSREEPPHGYRGSGRPAAFPEPERHLRTLKTWLWICAGGFAVVAALSLLYVKTYAQLADRKSTRLNSSH